jgi:hypothetical protein
MTRVRRSRAIIILSLILMPLLAAIPGLVLAQEGSVEIPINAHAKKYADGWACDRGYRESNEQCDAVNLPDNAYPTGRLQAHQLTAKRIS